MGLFSFIGKVAKAGLGVVTGGISTQILDAAGAVLKKKAMTNQMNAYERMGVLDYRLPPASRTESVMPGGGALRGVVRGARAAVKRAVTRTRKAAAPKAAKAPRAAKAAKALTPAQAKARAKSKAKYAQWKSLGKPGTFFDWIKANR